MGFNIGPKVITAPKGAGSIHRAGNYRVHQYPARYVTDGLVGHFDAAHPDSYPMTGNKWYDLSGANIMGPGTFNGNFVSPTGSTISNNNVKEANNTCFMFDQNISCNFSGGSTFPVLQTLTGEMWVRFLGASAGGFHVLFQKDGGYSGGMVYGIRATDSYAFTSHVFWGGGSGETAASQSTAAQSVNTWIHVAVRYDENFTLRLFVNGVDASTTSGVADPAVVPRQASGGGNIGTGDSRYCNADIGLFRLYNRALSNDEIMQNYNAEKVRYHNHITTFTPSCSGNKGKVEVLAVAGGGGGGAYAGGGGGGAGGLVHNAEYSVTNNTAIAVNVGAGGTGGSWNNANGSWTGHNTIFGTINAVGGGGGRSWGQNTGERDGGSGGGWHELSNNATDEATSGGSGTAGQGFKGGGSVKLGNNTEAGGGGGGGAGGLIYHSKFRIVSGKNYLINIGAGGTCIPLSGGLQGKNSTFGDLTAVGGGGGDKGNSGDMMSTSGGSGGGAGYQGYSESLHQGKGLSGQGYEGSKVIVTSPSSAGGAGGGGAGGPGMVNRPNHAGGYGGPGAIYSITGTAVDYGRGGNGGGGSDNARANTGDGGDAVYAQSNGQDSVSGRGYNGATGVLYIAYKGPQRGEGGTIDQTSRAGYTIHKFLTIGPDLFIG